jgi:hypothetical protein
MIRKQIEIGDVLLGPIPLFPEFMEEKGEEKDEKKDDEVIMIATS